MVLTVKKLLTVTLICNDVLEHARSGFPGTESVDVAMRLNQVSAVNGAVV